MKPVCSPSQLMKHSHKSFIRYSRLTNALSNQNCPALILPLLIMLERFNTSLVSFWIRTKTVVPEHQDLLSASKCPFVVDLFPPVAEESTKSSSKSSKFSSIGSRFKLQLQSLMETLNSTEPHYIRCVKPNNLLKPATFENVNIMQQLRCGGVLEAIRISCAGYPTHKTFSEFMNRFSLLAPDILAEPCHDPNRGPGRDGHPEP